ncbi:nucleotidyltransferase-like protein [Lysinibacillus piscis]|uniref:Nucleotidyltransferase-like n=1 Tax=Lysinibacillus piscis TaxID=2518931 RepID=A0ABQ5NQH4_9BACI|nr:nucleotidyltransferase-like protein [Lysinibacillus sp. KH24]GLC90274.1 hypothetical protein LYSBPC_34010 [Lysinibacillus sp. KH24]
MEQVLRPIYQERASQANTLGVILVEKNNERSNVTDTFDTILLIIVKEAIQPVFTKHYSYDDHKVALHTITEEQIRKWLLIGSNKKVVDWIFFGRVLFDRNEFFHKLKIELQEFPFNGRKIKIGIQFSKLIRRYLEGKEYFEKGHYLDAYSHVVDSLHYLGRLSIINSGLYPEVTVWAQVKKIEPAIYKLYEELVTSNESLEKRLELLFLASEFLIHSRTDDGARHILEVMQTKEFWTIQELHDHHELKNYSVDLEVFIEYLVGKGYILAELDISKSEAVFHRHYKVNLAMLEKIRGN